MIWTLLATAVASWLMAEYAHGFARRTRNEADYTWSAPRRKALYRLADKAETAGRCCVGLMGLDVVLALYYLFEGSGVL